MTLTLDETWERCLKMWRWIVAKYAGNSYSISTLKVQYLLEKEPERAVVGTCYFCDYSSLKLVQRIPGV